MTKIKYYNIYPVPQNAVRATVVQRKKWIYPKTQCCWTEWTIYEQLCLTSYKIKKKNDISLVYLFTRLLTNSTYAPLIITTLFLILTTKLETSNLMKLIYVIVEQNIGAKSKEITKIEKKNKRKLHYYRTTLICLYDSLYFDFTDLSIILHCDFIVES